MDAPRKFPPGGRPLTDEERALACWPLEHGESHATSFLPQLERARVVGGCHCGCTSIDFTVEGSPPPSGGLRVLGDFLYGTEAEPYGAFIFERGGVLAGLEVYGLAGDAPTALPSPSALRTYDAPTPR